MKKTPLLASNTFSLAVSANGRGVDIATVEGMSMAGEKAYTVQPKGPIQ